jgi:hypothetical protein
MSSTVQASRSAALNRRRRVRHKVHAPAYATFSGASKSGMLDLNEILDINEVGIAVQCASPLQVDQQVELCLDLAEARGQISTTARVVWSDASGRTGLGLAALPDSTLHRLREWLFLNAMVAAVNAASSPAPPVAPEHSVLRPSYPDTLAAASAVQREAESLGADLESVLSLIASRSQSLLRASGAAIALSQENTGKDAAAVSPTPITGTPPAEIMPPEIMICRASAGESAPPVGTALHVGSGFSGECVRTGTLLRCDDTETDDRVDRESCRAFGIRSILAAPVRSHQKVIGLLEVFSAQPNAFDENDSAVLRRFAETISIALHRPAPTPAPPAPPPPIPVPFTAPPGSILFAHAPELRKEARKEVQKEESSEQEQEEEKQEASADEGKIRLSRTHLYLLIFALATIALALGFILAPWIQEKIQAKLSAREHNGDTVLASSQPPADISKSDSSVDSLAQLRALAARADPTAENALGLLYAQGDEKQSIKPDDREAAAWFAKAAEHGSVSAQYKLGLLYWGGHHGLPKDPNKAYFWTVLARAGGQEGSKDLAKVLANGMTRAQAAAIEQQAEIWYQQHESHAKPSPAH